MKVIIIGAGIAGLAAANHLKNQGCSVKLLEARDRVGGRVAIDHSFGSPVDLGASWIHGATDNPVYDRLKQLGVKMTPYDDTGCDPECSSDLLFYDADYQLIVDSKPLTEAFGHALTHLHQINHISALKDILPKAMPKGFEEWVAKRISIWEGAEPEQIRVSDWPEDGDLIGDQFFVAESHLALLNDLSADLEIEFNTTVKEINYVDRISIETNQETYTADAVIITVPVACLKAHDIIFRPQLPEAFTNAIDCYGTGLINKIILECDACHWPQNASAIFQLSEDDNDFYGFINLYPMKGKPSLLTFTQGDKAFEMERWSDEQIKEKAQAQLRHYFPDLIVQKVLVSRWAQEPYSRCSYSYVQLNALMQPFDQMAQAIAGKLFFAGEAYSSENLGTTLGAYESGLHAASGLMAYSV